MPPSTSMMPHSAPAAAHRREATILSGKRDQAIDRLPARRPLVPRRAADRGAVGRSAGAATVIGDRKSVVGVICGAPAPGRSAGAGEGGNRPTIAVAMYLQSQAGHPAAGRRQHDLDAHTDGTPS